MKRKAISFRDSTKPLTVRQFWALSVLVPLFFMAITWPTSFNKLSTFLMAFSWYSIVGVTQSLGHSYIAWLLEGWIPWREKPMTRLLITIIAIVLYSVVAYVVVGTLLALFWYDISLKESFDIAVGGIWVAVKISGAFALIFATISFFVNWQKSQVEAERLEKEIANYRYSTLKNQVNPHFLFNSLNVLTDLVHEDADLSEKYILQLSKLYRYILESTNHKIVPLSEEVAFVESYIFLLKIRFGKKLKITMDIDSFAQEFIVPVALQMLIENAVKHNQITNDNPLEIDIYKKGGRIFIQNNLQLKTAIQDSTGTGLVNLEQQYKGLSDDFIEISNKNGFFTASLPLLEKKKENP